MIIPRRNQKEEKRLLSPQGGKQKSKKPVSFNFSKNDFIN